MDEKQSANWMAEELAKESRKWANQCPPKQSPMQEANQKAQAYQAQGIADVVTAEQRAWVNNVLGPIPQPKQTLFQLFSEAGFEAVRARLTEEISATFEKRIQSLLRNIDRLIQQKNETERKFNDAEASGRALAIHYCSATAKKEKEIMGMKASISDLEICNKDAVQVAKDIRFENTELQGKLSRYRASDVMPGGRKEIADLEAQVATKATRITQLHSLADEWYSEAQKLGKEIADLKNTIDKQAKQIEALKLVVDTKVAFSTGSLCMNDPDYIIANYKRGK